MRQALFIGLMLSAIAGCAANPTVLTPTPEMAQVLSPSALHAAATNVQPPSIASVAQDKAAAQAGATSDAWTDPSLLSAIDDPVGVSAYAASDSPFPDIHTIRFSEVSPLLYRGGLPSSADLAAMKSHGIKTDIDLMGEVPIFDTFLVAREKRWAKKAGVNFVQVKVHTGKVPFTGKVSDAEAEAFLKVALDPANQPCYVHCLHGRDRTGTMVAVFRMAHDHYTNAQAYAEMESFGFSRKSYPALASFVDRYVAPQAPVQSAAN